MERWSTYANIPYVSVTICIPGGQGANQCATIDHMQVDTGSTGVRVLGSALSSALGASLPAQTGATDDPTGNAPIVECAQFNAGYTWGSIKRADVTIGSKVAANMPIQVIADGKYSTPADCVKNGGLNLNTVAEMGANGVLGIAPAQRDYPTAATTPLPAAYYYCTSATSCSSTRVPLDTQVMNPVASFTSDNNGTIIRLPALPADGQASATGELVFGIGTQANDALPSNPNVLALNQGFFTTTYKGVQYLSAIDSGSNANFFTDTTVPYSGSASNYLFVPPTTLSLSAILVGATGGSTPVTVPFSLANGFSLLANQYAAYDSLGSPMYGSFLWGLPFFYGRSVYTALNNVKIGNLTGPFIAF
ncbi:hypothetical protein LMG28614_06081 [Paraburkholderia ultramafica]|uniref:DUF3443 domain-containing protein n=1 Tax=Paraburkholderia ultramafica TaxID=1544867 RepID=A0A6S7BN27_9BURK|nr:hypothetical protein LMG28614_06081 [Paraburkholderia ultramafica]